MRDISLVSLWAVYTRIANTTFGGGDPTMLALRRELVEQRGVLPPGEFGLSYTLARLTPGTNVLAFAAATGYQLRRWPGTLLAVLGASIPTAIVTVFACGAFQSWMRHPVGAAAISATLAAAVGLMLAGAWLIARPEFRRGRYLRSALFLLMSFGLAWQGWSPLEVIVMAAVAGAIWKDGGDR